MSQWGKLDRVNVNSTVSFTLNSTAVTNNSGAFTTANSAIAGYSINLANVNYGIASVTNVSHLRLDVVYSGTTGTTTDAYIQQHPKFLTTYGMASAGGTANAGVHIANVTNRRTVYGVDRTEVGVAGNKANGFSQPGWTQFNRYTTTQGSVRRKAEVLVAMSKNFNANAGGTLQADANDNTVVRNAQ